LVTGFSGFVSSHLMSYLSKMGETAEIIGLSRSEAKSFHSGNLKVRTYRIDLKDAERTNEIIGFVKPDYIIHLAADSSVAHSWQQPVESFQNNTNIFLNLIESVRLAKIRCRILSIGSSEEYGIVDPETVPLKESHILNPISPYAVARVSQELLSKIYVQGYGMDIVMTRSFNHFGPGQKESFVVSSFAKQLVQIKRGESMELEVGNIDIVRDFLDVRDVVRAYMNLLVYGVSGEIYNICSGTGYTLKSILEMMIEIAEIDLKYHVNPKLIRPSDNPIIIGCNNKISSLCNWNPEIPIEKSLLDIVNYWITKTDHLHEDTF
jgi:GDP-4-dehydro-6-deoxy-D-mannose reductase